MPKLRLQKIVFLLIYLKSKETERKRRQRSMDRELPTAGLLPKYPPDSWDWVGVKSGTQSKLGLPHGWQARSHLSYHLLCPKMYVIRKMRMQVEAGLRQGYRHTEMNVQPYKNRHVIGGFVSTQVSQCCVQHVSVSGWSARRIATHEIKEKK